MFFRQSVGLFRQAVFLFTNLLDCDIIKKIITAATKRAVGAFYIVNGGEEREKQY